jgi:hypothetical protein
MFILALFLLLTSSSLLNLGPKYQLQRAAWQIHSSLNSARYRALFKGTKLKVTFMTTSYEVKIYNEVSNAWNLDKWHPLEGVNIRANNSPTFHPNGSVSNLASIYVSNSWGEYKITIAISGRVKSVKL